MSTPEMAREKETDDIPEVAPLPEKDPLEDTRTKTMSLEEAFPSDREPADGELKSFDLTDRTPANDEKFKVFFREKGPYFAACWFLNYYAGDDKDESKVAEADLQARLKAIFRRDDNFTSYIIKAREWHRNRQPKI